MEQIMNHPTQSTAGMRLVQIWVPDTQAPGFRAEAARQARLVANTPESLEMNEWIAANSILADDEAW